jgi:hypothetical protein
MGQEMTPAATARKRRPLRILLIVVGALIGALVLLVGAVVLYFTVENAKAKRDAQPVFAEMDAAFGRVRLPEGYAVVRSERQGGYYDLFGYQSPGEFRVYAVPTNPAVPDELKAAVQAGGFTITQSDESCTFIAERGPVLLYVEFHRNPAVAIDITSSPCSPQLWPHAYVWIEIMGDPPAGYGQ